MAPVARELSEGRWLLHRDKIVRLLISCCLSQLLRLFAPEAPYDAEDLSRVFSLFAQQLRGLSEPTGAYYGYYFGLLEGLSTVKSIVLVWQIENNDSRDMILTELFKTAYALVHPSLNQTVKVYLLELLDAIIGECPIGQALPAEVFEETILKGLSNDKEHHIVQFTGEVIQLAGDNLGSMFSRHFNEILVGHSTNAAIEAVRTVHSQMVLVAKYNMDAITPVLQQVAQELLLEQQDLRTLALITLGRVFCITGNGHSYGQVWTSWLGRKNDRIASVRSQWISLAADMLSKLSDKDTLADLSVALTEKLLDPEEKVRERILLALYSMERLDKIPRQLLESITERCLDRKEEVRIAALNLLCRLISQLDITDTSNLSISIEERCMNWAFLPNSIFKLMYTNDSDSRLLFEYFIEHSVLRNMENNENLPLSVQATRWAWMWSCLDEAGRIGFKAWLRGKAQFVKLVNGFLQLQSAGLPKNSAQMNVVQQSLIERFRAPAEAQKALSALLDDVEMLEVLAQLVDPNSEPEEICAAYQSIMKSLPRKGIPPYILVYLAQRASWWSVNRAVVTQLLQWTSINVSMKGLVDLLMTELPILANNHGDYLVNACHSSSYSSQSLKALVHFCRTTAVDIGPLAPVLKDILKDSNDLTQVKHACRLLLLAESNIAPSLLEQAASDTAHPNVNVHSKAWQILRVLGKEKTALLPPYLDELILEYELVLNAESDEQLLTISTKFWSAVLPQLDPATLPRDRSKPIQMELLESVYTVLKSNSPVCLKALTVLLEGSNSSLSSLLEKASLLAALSADCESLLGKLSSLLLTHKTTPIILLPSMIYFCQGKDKAKLQHLSSVLRTWARSRSTSSDEDEHLIDSTSTRLAEDLLVPYLMLVSSTNLNTSYTFDEIKHLINGFIDSIVPATKDNLSYLYAIAVEVKRYMPAQFLATSVSARTLYLASELAQAGLRHKAMLLHCSLQAFPLPLRITDTAFTPLDPVLAQRNLSKSYLSKHRQDMLNKKPKHTSYSSKKTKSNTSTSSPVTSPTSERRRNPERSAKLPPGCIEAIMDILDTDSDLSDLDGMIDESENVGNEQLNSVASVPWKRRNTHNVTDFSIGTSKL